VSPHNNARLNSNDCRRKDSQVKADVQVLKTDFSQVAKANDIIINPGANLIGLEAKVRTNERMSKLLCGIFKTLLTKMLILIFCR